jgi:hypothetical protein
MKFIRYLFFFEGWAINLGVGLFCLILPAAFIANFTTQPCPPLVVEFIRWYGVLLMVLGYFEVRALRGNDTRALTFAIEALLFGDVLHFSASVSFVQAGAAFSLAVAFMFFMTVLLALTRTYWLYRTYRR